MCSHGTDQSSRSQEEEVCVPAEKHCISKLNSSDHRASEGSVTGATVGKVDVVRVMDVRNPKKSRACKEKGVSRDRGEGEEGEEAGSEDEFFG